MPKGSGEEHVFDFKVCCWKKRQCPIDSFENDNKPYCVEGCRFRENFFGEEADDNGDGYDAGCESEKSPDEADYIFSVDLKYKVSCEEAVPFANP